MSTRVTVGATIAANNARPIHAALRLRERRSRPCGAFLLTRNAAAECGRALWRDHWVIERGRGFGSGAAEIRSTIKSRKARILRGTYLRLT